MDIQVTLIDKNGAYKPLSTVVKNVESKEYYATHKREVQRIAIQQISQQRQLTWKELKALGFTKCMTREYTPNKWALTKRIEREAKKRGLVKYEQ